MLKTCLFPMILLHAAFIVTALGAAETQPTQGRWSCEKANAWYAKQPWLVGCNFIPSTAINQLEMWQADTFDPDTIDRELGWAQDLGFNTVRVYLHDLAYEQDPEGFFKRVDQFLEIAKRHEIKTIFIFFDDCWLVNPKIGKQPEPWTGVHNSGWLQSPGLPQLERYPTDAALRARLQKYVKAVLTRYRDDDRVLMWDLYNEAGGWSYLRGEKPGLFQRKLVGDRCFPLLRDVYCWAREVNPSQPVTTCWYAGASLKAATEWADVFTFHHYCSIGDLNQVMSALKPLTVNRPMICTEYLARTIDSRFETHLPYFREHKIGAINWGFVAGKTNTMWGWGSWEQPGTPEPKVWFHDIFRKDGTPFDANEVATVREILKKK